jgi:AcrR family transcriptional regulator
MIARANQRNRTAEPATPETSELDTAVISHEQLPFVIARASAVFERSGLAAISIRSVATEAELPAATVQRLFGSKDQLLQHVYSAVVQAEMAWLEGIAEKAAGENLSRNGVFSLYRSIICGRDGISMGRQIMLVEMLVASTRDSAIAGHVRNWLEAIQSLWIALLGKGDVSRDLALFLTELQIGLLMDSIGCHEPFDTALANGEVITRALYGAKSADRTWFRYYLRRAVKADPLEAGVRAKEVDKAQRLLDAGAEIVAAQGASSLSFRSLAARAGVTFSTASAVFRNKTTMFYEIYQHMYAAIIHSPVSTRPGGGPFENSVELMLHLQFGAPFHIACAELRLLAARDSSYSQLAWHMRMTNGQYEAFKDDPTFDATGASAFDAHATAIWLFGCALANAIYANDRSISEVLEKRVRFGLRQFDGP